MKDIYTYTDYRLFLSDYFTTQKNEHPHFSHQFFAKKAGIHSSGFVLHVMKGERNLTKSVVLKIARAIGFTAAQTDYFDDMVSFDQAKTPGDKEYYFSRIAAKRRSVQVKTMEDRQYEFYSQWYHSVIRELVTMTDIADSGKDIAKLLIPNITPIQFKKSLKLQEELGILRKLNNNTYEQVEPFLEAGGALRNLALVNYQKQMLQQAVQAWERFESNEIMMSTVTLSMPESMMETVKKEIRNFKRKLFDIASKEQNKCDRVFHINMNVFPVTKAIKDKHHENNK